MRLILFSLVFVVLVAAASLAQGLEMTRLDARAEYSDAYVYRLEQIEQMSRVNYASIPLKNNSVVNLDVYPGSNLTFRVLVENTFRNSNDTELRNIIVTVKVEGTSKDFEDLEERSADFNLEPGSSNRADILFEIPSDIQSGAHNVKIEVEGEGQNRTEYKTELKLKLTIKRHSHDIAITKAFLSPSIVDCKRKIKIEAEAVNLGSSAEDQVALEFKSTTIGINSVDRNISLASSNNENEGENVHAKSLSIEVPPFFKAGTYPITVNLYWKNLVLFDQKTLNLVVKDCSRIAQQTDRVQNESNDTSFGIIGFDKGTAENQNERGTTIQKFSLLSSPMLLIIFSGGFITLFMAAIIIFGYFIKSRAH